MPPKFSNLEAMLLAHAHAHDARLERLVSQKYTHSTKNGKTYRDKSAGMPAKQDAPKDVWAVFVHVNCVTVGAAPKQPPIGSPFK